MKDEQWAFNESIDILSNPIPIEAAAEQVITEYLRAWWLNVESETKKPSLIYKNFWFGRTYYIYGFFKAAIPYFRAVTKLSGPTLEKHERLLVGRAWGQLGLLYGALYLDEWAVTREDQFPLRNDWESVRCYQIEATIFNYPGAKYYYGKALVYGTGGVERNIPEGMKYLHQAASHGIGEAYLELGSIYERGIGQFPGDVVRDTTMAHGFYLEAVRVYKGKMRDDGWTPEIWGMHKLLHAEAWDHLEDTISETMGQRFTWSMIGQSFLLGAAAAFANGETFPKHYPDLLYFIPIFGILISIFLILVNCEAIIRVSKERKDVANIRTAKIAAYGALLHAVEVKLSHKQHPFKSVLSGGKKRYKDYTSMCKWRNMVNRSIQLYASVVPLAFLYSWLIILVRINI